MTPFEKHPRDLDGLWIALVLIALIGCIAFCHYLDHKERMAKVPVEQKTAP